MSDATTERLTAFTRLAVFLISGVTGCLGFALDADAVFTAVALVVALVSGVVSWWKNNNITVAAQQAQNYLDAIRKLKSEKEAIDEEEVEV